MESGQGRERVEITIPMKSVVSTLMILGVLVILAGAATHIIPAGKFMDVSRGGELVKVYQRVDPAPVPFWKIPLAPLLAVTGKNGIKLVVVVVFIMVLGGAFSVLIRTGVISEMLARLEHSFAERRTALLVACSLTCAFLSSTFGMMEEFLPVLIIFVPFALRMGWDELTGFAVILLMVGFGFAAATFNPFTVGVAQSLADLPLFSGVGLRAALFLVVVTVSILYILRYVRLLERDPTRSLTYRHHGIRVPGGKEKLAIGQVKNARGIVTLILVCFGMIAASVAVGTQVKIVGDLIMIIIMLLFVILGLSAGLLSGERFGTVLRYFVRGLGDFSAAIPLVMFAFSVSYLVEVGLVLDTILNFVAERLAGFGQQGGVVILFFSQMAINFFVPSGSGQAALTIPILAPLGDLIGVSRQTIVLAFQMGDGFSNMLWPTNPFLMIGLGFAGIRYTTWLKWSLPIHLIIMAICIAFLLLAVNIGYN